MLTTCHTVPYSYHVRLSILAFVCLSAVSVNFLFSAYSGYYPVNNSLILSLIDGESIMSNSHAKRNLLLSHESICLEKIIIFNNLN